MKKNFKEKRKVLLILPLFVFPFLALTFNALGGGKGLDESNNYQAQKGINTNLPDASFKGISPQDKLAFYEQSKQDSLRTKETNGLTSVVERLGFPGQKEDPRANQINLKLEKFNAELNRPEPQPTVSGNISYKSESSIKNDVDRLEALMKAMQSGKTEDPEMRELSSMLDKIITIQNPGKVQENFKQQVLSTPDSAFKATRAAVEGNQKIKQGGLVKLKLLDSIRIKGVLIPQNQLVYGVGSITNQRLLVTITNIRLGSSIIPVNLSVFSLDGLIGINAPEAELSGAAANGASDVLQGTQFLTMDQSFGIQAAGAGIDAAKSLLNKKVKRIRVKLNSSLPVFLRNNQSNFH
jgi:hypothetical protein